MREVWRMWNYATMVVLTVLTAALFAAILIPFKGIPLIPGHTELRPANVIPVVCGLLFGPAGAWGAAFGNLIGDFFGTLGIGSFFGFWGNFLAAYLPYKLWQNRPLDQIPAPFAPVCGRGAFGGHVLRPGHRLRGGGLQSPALRHHRGGGPGQQRPGLPDSRPAALEAAGAPGGPLGPRLAGADGPGGLPSRPGPAPGPGPGVAGRRPAVTWSAWPWVLVW